MPGKYLDFHCCRISKCRQNSSIVCYFSSKNAIQQRFSLPKDVIEYIIKNQKLTSDLYFKLYSLSKYFYLKLKIIPCSFLSVFKSDVQCCYQNKSIKSSKIKFLSSGFKLLVDGELHLYTNSFITFLQKSEVHVKTNQLSLRWMHMDLKELAELTQSVEILELYLCKIENPIGEPIPLEEIIKYVPNVNGFIFKPQSTLYYTPQTTKNLAKMERIKKLKYIRFDKVPQNFNAEDFITFVKKNTNEDEKKIIYISFHIVDDPETEDNFLNFLKKSIKNKNLVVC